MSMTALPRYQLIAGELRRSIEDGALPTGCKLPSVRALGSTHGVSVLTALQALRALEQERYVEARPRSGFYVARRREHHGTEPRPIEVSELDEQAETHLSIVGMPCRVRLDLANGESSLYPIEKLGVLMRQLIYRDPELLGNHIRGTGYIALKQQIMRRAFEYGCSIQPNELIITHGCIESISLALRATTKPGDGVAVESPTYFVILQMLRSLGLRAVEIPTTKHGMSLDVLEKILQKRQASAVICIANIGNPMGITMSVENKEKLVSIAAKHDAIVIEDGIYGDTSFDGSRPKPLRAFSKKVILCSSFSKTLAPGIRVGWIAGGRWSNTIASTKYTSTMATPIYSQAAIAEFIRSGGYDVHLRRLKRTLQYQAISMRRAIIKYFPSGTLVSSPTGGYVLWVELPFGYIGTRQLFEAARREGIGIAPGHLFATDDRFDRCFRLNAGFGWNDEVEKAIVRLAEFSHHGWHP